MWCFFMFYKISIARSSSQNQISETQQMFSYLFISSYRKQQFDLVFSFALQENYWKFYVFKMTSHSFCISAKTYGYTNKSSIIAISLPVVIFSIVVASCIFSRRRKRSRGKTGTYCIHHIIKHQRPVNISRCQLQKSFSKCTCNTAKNMLHISRMGKLENTISLLNNISSLIKKKKYCKPTHPKKYIFSESSGPRQLNGGSCNFL